MLKGEYMDIIISNSSSKPIYEQITSQIKTMVMTNELHSGDPLPSMRSLAKTLRISVITVQRAYEDLTKDGFIETTVGKGSFIREENKEIIKEEKQKEIERYLEQVVTLAKETGVNLSELTKLLRVLYEGE